MTKLTGTLATQYPYNADSVRVSKTVDGITTQYVLDLAAAPPDVTSDPEAIYARLDTTNA